MYSNSDVFFKVYFDWRQVDCHISNLYNTSFWGLIRKCTLSPQDGENELKGILAKDKKRDSVFFRDVPEIYEKKTVLVRKNPSGRIFCVLVVTSG